MYLIFLDIDTENYKKLASTENIIDALNEYGKAVISYGYSKIVFATSIQHKFNLQISVEYPNIATVTYPEEQKEV